MKTWHARTTEWGLLAVVVAVGAVYTAVARFAPLMPPISGTWWWVLGMFLLIASVGIGFSRPVSEQTVLAIAAMLVMFGTATIARLDPSLLTDPNVPSALVMRHEASIAVGLLACVVLALALRVEWVRRYKYTWLLASFLLVVITLIFGRDVRGAKLWLQVGPAQFQPSEVLRLTVAAYLAAYLTERRDVVAAGRRVGPMVLPPVAHLVPLGVVGAGAVLLLVLQNDLGTALLLFGITVAMLYAATGRASYVVIGLVGFALLARLAQMVVSRLDVRVQNWADPWRDPLASGYQQVQSEYALAAGGALGVGPGRGAPYLIPDVHTDFILAAIGEELGVVGVAAVLLTMMLLIARGMMIALRAPDGFERLLAVGLVSAIALQTLIIAAGVLRLVPLTGLTLPFVSYGGSAMVTNLAVIGVLLAVSRSRSRAN